MAFTDRNGNEYDESFWILSRLNIDTVRRELTIEFTAWRDIAAFEANDPSLASDGGYWAKTFIGDSYDRLIAKYGQTVFSVVSTAVAISNDIFDTPNADASDFVSFFDAASDIITQ